MTTTIGRETHRPLQSENPVINPRTPHVLFYFLSKHANTEKV
jgi:hypothetical protein